MTIVDKLLEIHGPFEIIGLVQFLRNQLFLWLMSDLRIRTLPSDSAFFSTLERFCLASEYVYTSILRLQINEVDIEFVCGSSKCLIQR